MTNSTAIALAFIAYVLLKDRGASGATKISANAKPWRSDLTLYPALLSEYYPDTPITESRRVKRREGGPVDTKGKPLITISQHESDKIKYPYISVSSDIIIDGNRVPYGSRVYFKDMPPDLIFRIVDTGDNFRWDRNKQIHIPGHEPFDIAVNWNQKGGRIAGLKTWYAIDMSDNLERKRAPNA